MTPRRHKLRTLERLESRDLLTTISVQPHSENVTRVAESSEVEVVDFDGDGDLDIVSLSRTDAGFSRLLMHENMGNAEFAAAQVLTDTGKDPYGLVTSEGKRSAAWLTPRSEDFVEVHSFTSLRGVHQFSTHAKSVLDAALAIDGDEITYNFFRFGISRGAVVRHGTFNSDTTTDSFVYSEPEDSEPRIGVYGRTFGGGFGNQQLLAEPVLFDAPLSDYRVADFNGDDRADVIAVSQISDSSSRIMIFEATTRLELVPTHSYDVTGAVDRLRLFDIDSDGDKDVIARTSDGSGQVIWLEQEENALAAPRHLIDVPTSVNDADVGDLNGDGLLDIVMADESGVTLRLGNSTNGESVVRFAAEPSFPPKSLIHAVDLDKDGIDDLVATSIRSHRLMYRRGLGDGTFSMPIRLADRLGNVVGFEPVDFDDDGDMDFLVTSSDTGRIFWLEHISLQAEFVRHLISPPTLKPGPAIAADLDGDGDQDVLSWTPGQREIKWFHNTNGFGAKSTTITADGPVQDVTVLDSDGDGDLDFVTSEEAKDNRSVVMLYENRDGFGTMSRYPIRAQRGFTQTHFAVSTQDSLQDYLVVERQREPDSYRMITYDLSDPATPFSWRHPLDAENAGMPEVPQLFAKANIFPLATDHLVATSKKGTMMIVLDSDSVVNDTILLDATPAYSMAAADFDSDGDIDMVVATDAGLRLLENTTPALLGDFNRDGVRDALDIDSLCIATSFGPGPQVPGYDFNQDGHVSRADFDSFRRLVFDAPIGDSNLDGVFDSSDLVQIFQSGRYESKRVAGWSEGDWNCDRQFSSRDFVTAFEANSYQQNGLASRSMATMFAAVVDQLFEESENRSSQLRDAT